jgi:hypothetical protein
MKRKIATIIVFAIICISSFSFAGEDDFPVILGETANHSFDLECINE